MSEFLRYIAAVGCDHKTASQPTAAMRVETSRRYTCFKVCTLIDSPDTRDAGKKAAGRMDGHLTEENTAFDGIFIIREQFRSRSFIRSALS